MKTIIISENQRGLKFKNGKFVKLLAPGKHFTFKNTTIELLELEKEISSTLCTASTLLNNQSFADATAVVDVPDNHIALHYVDGNFKDHLTAGKHIFFRASGAHTFKLFNMTSPEIPADFPFELITSGAIGIVVYKTVTVAEHERARLYYDSRFERLLEPGTYYFWRKSATKVTAETVDTRILQLNILGQELLTLDKVTIRVNFVCNYKISDYIKISTELSDYEAQLHVAVQLALRDYIAKHKLDDILENKDAISAMVFEKLKEQEARLYVELYSADIRDIILPGEIRDIMNTVLLAEKKAQASVITRREEVASTRSLLNTAKLMEENPTLYKLKELEYIERICENVENLTLTGSQDLLSQLASLLGKPSET